MASSATGQETAPPTAADMGRRSRVLVREPTEKRGLDLLRNCYQVEVDPDRDMEDRISDFEAIIVRSSTKLIESLLERSGRLRVIGRAGIGVDNVEVKAATRHTSGRSQYQHRKDGCLLKPERRMNSDGIHIG